MCHYQFISIVKKLKSNIRNPFNSLLISILIKSRLLFLKSWLNYNLVFFYNSSLCNTFIIVFPRLVMVICKYFKVKLKIRTLLQNSMLLLMLKLLCISSVKKILHHVNQMMMFIYTYRRDSYEFQASYHIIISQLLSVNYNVCKKTTLLIQFKYDIRLNYIKKFFETFI